MTPSQVLQNLRGDSTLNAKTVAIASAADDGDSTLNARMALVVAVSYLGLGLIATFAGDVLVPVFVERATTSSILVCEYSDYYIDFTQGSDSIEEMCETGIAQVVIPEMVYWRTYHLDAIVAVSASIVGIASLALLFVRRENLVFNQLVVDALCMGLVAMLQVSVFALAGFPSIYALAFVATCRLTIDVLRYRSHVSCAVALAYATILVIVVIRITSQLDVTPTNRTNFSLLVFGCIAYDAICTFIPYGVARRTHVPPAWVAAGVRVGRGLTSVLLYTFLVKYSITA